MFLGFSDVWIAVVYISCILSTVLCVGYGLYNWNRGAEGETEAVKSDEWVKAEVQVKANA